MTRCLSSFVLIAAVALFAGSAWAQLPEGPGKAELERLCKNCHEPEQATSERMNREDWTKTLEKMIEAGATGTDEEFNLILEYLVKNFGPEPPKPVNVNKATAVELESALTIPRTQAEAIVQYRTEKGNFKTIADLKKVPGLDAAKVEAKKERLAF
jgi:competence protein ComEA